MSKTPVKVALERQIPEYIRGEYELFVNFIKAYYEFLDQTQRRNLEDIRSIENTLEEFVIRFKKELSVLFPTNTLANERFILQKIREFYQTRGSKESFQFLFRILFNKDSEIFYPSTQILRASDGKWIQEKSVFVRSRAGNLFNLSQKMIKIETNNKEIFAYCPRVVLYKEDIYEVFINRSYVQDITVGNTVKSENNADYGEIVQCPNKYTIISKGAGFEVGQLLYLKTESGDGSLIKITKTGTNGSIERIQIISFGLDYESTFYAKLSNKQSVAPLYYSPVTIFVGQATVPNTYNPDTTLNKYADGNNGFVDYGYINTQDYFYFDVNLPAGQRVPGRNDTVFYADGTYVGEIIGSFYTNDANTNVIDEDTAEIKVELGPVAIYPGYYQTSDGFISDESYIQDGKYYQLFSYVIRVEQQIDTYLDIVKQLLHPAGTELFAEFNVKNEYLVSAAPLLAFIRIRAFDQQFVTDDEGENKTELFFRRYLSNGTLSTETDPRRWSTADAIQIFKNNVKDSGDKNDIVLSIRRYNSDGTLITTETDQRRWSIIDPLAPFAHDIFSNGLDDAYVLNMGSFDPVTGIAIAPFVDSPTEAMGDFSKVEDFKIPTLSIRKYDSSGNLTDQRRWSTVDALHTFPHDVNTGGQDNFYVVNLSIRRYDSDGNIITSETDQRRWSLATPSTVVANLASGAVRHFEISSIVDGTFYKTVSGISAFDSNRLAGTLPSGRPESERDRIVSTLLVRKYDSSGNLTGETDQRRWSTVDAIHDFPHDVNTGGLDNFYKVDLSIRKYDNNGNLTDQRRWSTVDPSNAFAHDILNSPDFYELNIGSAEAPNSYFIKTATALSAFDSNRLEGILPVGRPESERDRIESTLSIKKYDSFGNDFGETDERRWSTAEAVHTFPHEIFNNGQDNFYEVTLLIGRYDKNGNLINEGYPDRWSIALTQDFLNRNGNPDLGSGFRVTYDRSIVPLVSLDPAVALSAFGSNRLAGTLPSDRPESERDRIESTLSIRKYNSAGEDTGETDTRRWSISSALDGAVSGVADTKFIVSPQYFRAPQLTLTGTVVAGSNVMTLTGTSTTNGVQNGRILTKVSGTGELGAGQVRVQTLNSSTTFTMHTINANGVSTPAPASVTGTIVFTLSFDTPELAQFVDTPVDSFPDGSVSGVVKFLFSSLNSDGTPRIGGTWADFPIPQDVLNRMVVYDRSTVPLVSLDPAAAIEGGRTFALDSLENDRITPRNGGTWTDLLSSPTDNRSGSKIEPSYQDTINNTNPGTFYYNVYNQDTSDPLSSFSYFAEGYAEVITRALS